MRIFYFIDALADPHSGTEKQLLLMIKDIAARGHDVRLFVLRDTDYTRTVSDFPCPIECLNINSLASPTTLTRSLRLRRNLVADAPDVVHAFFNDCAMLVPFLAPGSRCRVFSSRRDMGYWYTPAALMVLAVANRLCHFVICNSDAVAQNVARRERLPIERTKVIYNSVEPAVPAKNQLDDAVDDFISDPSSINICLVANIRRIKRIEDLLVATRIVADAGRRLNVYVAGEIIDQEYRSELEDYVVQLGLKDIVHWTGTLADPRTLMQKCDIGVLTSTSEGFSNTLLEYFAESLAVVCSDVGGNPELVVNDETGYLYTAGDVHTLAQRLIDLADDAEKRRRIGDAARLYATRFSTDMCITRHLDLYAGHDADAVQTCT
jgi:glycosyltransferase involved in cell wall biosynthesis